ncbi:MAG: TPM domain-containing protein [bacterium]|nr:TPM domain-containing protein [bacterium]
MKSFALALVFLVPSIIFGYTSPGKPGGFVNDFASILRPETVSSLNQKLEQFSKETGNEISVVTISKLEDETIETYAETLFQEWGIGKEKEDNGLLLLISLVDREMRIEVGYGLEPLVTDIDSGRIIREILTPAFQSGDYDLGISKAVDTIIGLIGGEEMAPNRDSGSINNWSRLLPYIIFAFIYLVSILGRSKSWWAGGVIGGVLGIIFFSGILFVGMYILIGLIFDFIVSRAYIKTLSRGGVPPWWIGGGGLGGGSGGFGGFGGGMSGGGGASGRW